MGTLDEFNEPIEIAFPMAAIGIQPVMGVAQGTGAQVADTPARADLPFNQPGVCKHAKVLRNRRRRHVERAPQFAHRSPAFRQTCQDGAAGRVGQGGKD